MGQPLKMINRFLHHAEMVSEFTEGGWNVGYFCKKELFLNAQRNSEFLRIAQSAGILGRLDLPDGLSGSDGQTLHQPSELLGGNRLYF